MAGNVNTVNRAASPLPYVNTKQQSQNTKELFDMLKPMQTGAAKADSHKTVDKTSQQIIETIKKQFVSNESNLASAGLKKLLDTLSFLNNKAGAPILNDKELQAFMLKPETLLKELNRQHKGASIFTGELFDILRNVLKTKAANPADKEKVKDAVVNFLRQYANTYLKSPKTDMQPGAAGQNTEANQVDAQNAKNAVPEQQGKSVQQTQNAAPEQQGKSVQQTQNAAPEQQGKSGRQTQNAASEQQGKSSGQQNIQNEGKSLETAYKRAENLLSKATDKLVATLSDAGPAFDKAKAQLEATRASIPQMISKQSAESSETQKNTVINNMLDIILTKLDESGGNASVKIYGEQIVRGMLNNNTFNQPLMHFLLPVRYEGINAFAEMWVDPDAQNPEAENQGKGKGKSIRVFLTVDLEEKGKAEIDVMLTNNKIYTGLFYPEEIAEGFKDIKQYIAEVTKESGYSVGTINVEPLKIEHKLDEIVKRPLERRMSLDAKV